MKLIQVVIVFLMLFAATNLAAGQEKNLICHVGNKESRSGETYLDDPDCKGGNCPDAGKIDLIMVAHAAMHLDNPAHMYDSISDYRPEDIGASGVGTEDSNGDGVDDGCEPPPMCGDCLTNNDYAGCEIDACETAVCAFDPFCCEVRWDFLCVAEAEFSFCVPDICLAPPD